MPAARSIIGQCPDCCDCPTPQALFYPRITVSCASRSGTATLCGISGYHSPESPYDAGDPWAWAGQMRKWRKRNLDGEIDYSFYHSENCENCAEREKRTFSGSMVIGCGGIEEYAEGIIYQYWDGCAVAGPPLVTAPTIVNPRPPDSHLPCSNFGGPFVNAPERTLTSLIVTTCPGCVNGYFGTVSNPRFSIYTDAGQVSETLDEEQAWYDALGADEDVIEGSSCCAHTTSANATSPESPFNITSELTAVRLTILVKGLPATTYPFRLRLSHQNLDNLSEEIEDTYVELSATTDSEGIAEIEYDIEQPAPDRSTCYAGVEADAYQFRFRRPRVGSGKCYRITWVERLYDPEVGMSIVSIPVAKGGSGYTTAPEVTIGPPNLSEDDGGVQAEATAVVTDGRVTAINVTVAGAGYYGHDVYWWNGYVGVTIAPPDGEDGKQAVAGCVRLSGDTEREWEWDGEPPEGYSDDPETWPLTEVHTVTVPEGWRWHLACVSSECRGCA